jgi:heme-degrading monooxygenase HmoA
MITVGMNYMVREGKGETFESLFNKILQVMNDMPGHARSQLFCDVNEPQRYLIVSEWNDRQAFDTFVASDRFKGVTDVGKADLLAERPRHDVYESPAAASHSGPPAGGGCPVHHG